MALDAAHKVPDHDLLCAYAQGDPRAAEQLTVRLLPKVFAHARRLLGSQSEAEDVAQEAMMRLWRIAPDWRVGEAQVSTWLYRVTANLCMDRLRKRRAVALDEIAEPTDTRPSVATQLQERARLDALQGALNDLPDRQRQAVVLRHIDGLSNDQIAEIMQLGVRAVESLTARGKRALTDRLAGRKDALGYADDV